MSSILTTLNLFALKLKLPRDTLSLFSKVKLFSWVPLELSLTATEYLEQEHAELDRLWQQRQERTAYEVERAAREIHAVEPELWCYRVECRHERKSPREGI